MTVDFWTFISVMPDHEPQKLENEAVKVEVLGLRSDLASLKEKSTRALQQAICRFVRSSRIRVYAL